MPLIDKPLPELRTYRGINPRPVDFDTYWAEALRELDALDPQVELRPSPVITPRNAEVFDLWFTGVGGARVHAKYVRPRGLNDPAPAVLQFHGYSGNSGDWQSKLALAGQGVCVAALDCRGQSGLSEDKGGVRGTTLRGHIVRGLDDPNPHALLFRQIFLDTAQLARIVMARPEVDARRVGAMGASQGGALALACAALEPRLARCATIYPFLCDYQRVWEMDLGKAAYAELTEFFRWFDPRHEREREIFTRLGYIDVQHLAPRIRAEVLMGTGLADAICPPSTQFAAFNRIEAKKDVVIYPDFAHEELPGMQDRIFSFMLGL